MSTLRVYGLLLRVYPPTFRSEYGSEMMDTIHKLGAQREYRGAVGRLRLGLRTVPDLLRGAAVEWIQEARASGVSPSYGYALAAAAGVWLLYVVTLAPTAAFWDAGEYVTAAHTLGIPHPPGNPLFVLLAHLWEKLLAPLDLSVAVRINLLSASASAAAHGFWFLVVERLLLAWTPSRTVRRVGALTAVLVSATAFTVWNQSNVNEKVYTLSLLTVAAVSWLALVWRDKRAGGGSDARWLVLIAFLIALTAANHLMGVLVGPAVLVMVLMAGPRSLFRPRVWVGSAVLVTLALSVHLFLPHRAAQDPILSEGDPRCEHWRDAVVSLYTWGGSTIPGLGIKLPTGCAALSESLTREQYRKPPLTQDPTVYPYQDLPRGPGLIRAQLVQYAQYFDWQWARSIAGHATVFGGARPLVTLVFLVLGLLGAAAHVRRDRAGATYVGVLFLIYSLGLVWYLNFKYGYALEWDRFPVPDAHEVRERDYFFVIGFSVWALWVGCGLTTLWQRLAAWMERGRAFQWGRSFRWNRGARAGEGWPLAQWAASPVLVIALLPLGLNWSWASRAEDWTARDFAYNMLMSVEPYGVLFTYGDNDTFPLWYLQEVEGIRRDVTVAVMSYLNTPWYVKQLRGLSQPCPPGVDPSADPTRIICQRPYRPREMPPALLSAGVPTSVLPPGDSAFPVTDKEIESITAGTRVTDRPIRYNAGGIEATIPEGTMLEPADTFVAIVVQRTLGDRPIHFSSPAPTLQRLGLEEYGVRVGLTIQIDESLPALGTPFHQVPESPQPGADPLRRVRIPGEYAAALGAPYVDVTRTDTLLEDVFRRRGSVMDPNRPWADSATTNILRQYASAHLSLAAAWDVVGESDRAADHLERFAWWRDRGSE